MSWSVIFLIMSMGVTSGGDGGDASPPQFFVGGIVPPTLGRMMWGGPSPPHYEKLYFLSIKIACSNNFLETSSYKICMWWLSDKQEIFRPVPKFRNQWLVNKQNDKRYIIEFQLSDSKFKVWNVIHMMKPAIFLENTTDTRPSLIVFSSYAHTSTAEHKPQQLLILLYT